MLSSDIVTLARSWIGTPYHNMAAVKGRGVDSIGLIRGIWTEIHGTVPEVPHYTPRWSARNKGEETLLNAARQYLTEVDARTRGPGIVLGFRVHPKGIAQHCGIMTTMTEMVHSHSGREVYEVTLGERWESKVVAAFKFPEVED